MWRDRISASKGQKDQKSRNELRQIIEQVLSVKFEPVKNLPESFIVIEPVPTASGINDEPNGFLSDTDTVQERKEKETKSELPYTPVTDQTLQILVNMTQHPDQMDNPFELAEILFLSGYLEKAAVFYQEALNRTTPGELDLANNRAWILFQIGNCLRTDDMLAARKIYRQLIAEYPNSPWTNLAKTLDKLIDWHLKDKPRTLIAENRISGFSIEYGVSHK